MKPEEALEWAADFAERSKIWEAPKNDRGYAKSGWTEPTPAEKVALIIELAATVTDSPNEVSGETAGAMAHIIKFTVEALDAAKQVDPVGYNYPRISKLHSDLKKLVEGMSGA